MGMSNPWRGRPERGFISAMVFGSGRRIGGMGCRVDVAVDDSVESGTVLSFFSPKNDWSSPNDVRRKGDLLSKLMAMKTTMQIFMCVVAIGILTGCASTKPQHEHAMACSKCACSHFEADAAKPGMCSMCGHGAADHNAGSPTTSEHAEHQH